MRIKKDFKIGRDRIKTLHFANVSFFSSEKNQTAEMLLQKGCQPTVHTVYM